MSISTGSVRKNKPRKLSADFPLLRPAMILHPGTYGLFNTQYYVDHSPIQVGACQTRNISGSTSFPTTSWRNCSADAWLFGCSFTRHDLGFR